MESIWKIAEKRKAEGGIVKIDNEAVSKSKNISEASSLMEKWEDCSWISAVEKHWDVIVIGVWWQPGFCGMKSVAARIPIKQSFVHGG